MKRRLCEGVSPPAKRQKISHGIAEELFSDDDDYEEYLDIFEALQEVMTDCSAHILCEIASFATGEAVEFCKSCNIELQDGSGMEIECDGCGELIHDIMDECAFVCGPSQYNGGDCGRRYCQLCSDQGQTGCMTGAYTCEEAEEMVRDLYGCDEEDLEYA